MTKTTKLPRDTDQLAKAVVDLATMDEREMKDLQKQTQKRVPQKPGKRGSASRT